MLGRSLHRPHHLPGKGSLINVPMYMYVCMYVTMYIPLNVVPNCVTLGVRSSSWLSQVLVCCRQFWYSMVVWTETKNTYLPTCQLPGWHPLVPKAITLSCLMAAGLPGLPVYTGLRETRAAVLCTPSYHLRHQ